MYFLAPYSNWYNNSICTAPINYANFTCLSSADCVQTVGLECATLSSNCDCPTPTQNGMCDCATGFYWDNTRCTAVLACGNSCLGNYQCQSGFSCTGSNCT